jgi:hypothetical protein
MVESNGRDYAAYLCNVFADDAAFQTVARDWAEEEVQHGLALGRWASLADPDFDYEASLRRFRAGYQLDTDAKTSVRGSRVGELIARCMVEVGTSSYYTAIGEAAREPVLRAVCREIARDEFRHYGIFYRAMRRYLASENLGLTRRLMIAFSRIAETEDDELAYAYYAANGRGEVYDRKTWNAAYARHAYALYRPRHVEPAVVMVLRAVGLKPRGLLSRILSRTICWFLDFRAKRLARPSSGGAGAFARP